jgi:redox-sensitive bicupin YhaK (pirin superfamily)
MNTDRIIKKVVKAYETLEGGGVIVKRALPSNRVSLEDVDPFLLLDEAEIDPKGPGFPEHPHRGFEIITYIFSGWAAHKDDQGNEGRIESGGVMKLSAGSGIWHGEQAGLDASQPSSRAHGLQFWVNLPKADKTMKPNFQLLQAGQVHEVKSEGSLTRVIVGPDSPIRIVTPINYLDVTVAPGKSWSWELSPDWQGYAYVIDGSGKFGSTAIEANDAELAVLGSGGNLRVANDSSLPLRFMLAAGQPLRQSVLWNGPFVD